LESISEFIYLYNQYTKIHTVYVASRTYRTKNIRSTNNDDILKQLVQF